MDDSTESPQTEESDLYSTPLRTFVEEVHEIFEELKSVGFSDVNSTQIVAHMLMYGVAYRDSSDDGDDEDEDEDDEDDGISS